MEGQCADVAGRDLGRIQQAHAAEPVGQALHARPHSARGASHHIPVILGEIDLGAGNLLLGMHDVGRGRVLGQATTALEDLLVDQANGLRAINIHECSGHEGLHDGGSVSRVDVAQAQQRILRLLHRLLAQGLMLVAAGSHAGRHVDGQEFLPGLDDGGDRRLLREHREQKTQGMLQAGVEPGETVIQLEPKSLRE